MKIIGIILSLSFILSAAPDCQKNYRFSNRAGDGAITSQQEYLPLVGGAIQTGAYDNRGTGCNSWAFSFDSEGFSALSIQLEDAPAGNGVVGSFVAFAGTALSGSNPSTVTTSASYLALGYYPYLRINLATATGTGSINVTLIGYKSPAQIGSFNSVGSFGLAAGTVNLPSLFMSPDTATGWYRNNTNQWTFTAAGHNQLSIFSTLFRFADTVSMCWSGTPESTASCDSSVSRNAAGIVAIGVNATVGGNTGTLNVQNWLGTPVLFAALGTPTNGTFLYCSDCTVAATCAGSGTGSLAKRLAGVWVCN